jgi:hypothetical protein
MKIQLLLLSVLAIALTSCAGLQKKQDCRVQSDVLQVRKEIVADIYVRFPKYQSIAISDVGLSLNGSGWAYYPATVKLKSGEQYSIIYNYSPENEQCKKLGYQFIKLTTVH